MQYAWQMENQGEDLDLVLTGSSGREEPPSEWLLPAHAHPGSSPGDKTHIYGKDLILQRAYAFIIDRGCQHLSSTEDARHEL